MTREERKEIWERYLTDNDIIEVKFIGQSDLLSDYPVGNVHVHSRTGAFRSKEFNMGERERIALLNFDSDREVTTLMTLCLVGDEYSEYINECLEEEREFRGDELKGLVVIDILKDGEFIWNYKK